MANGQFNNEIQSWGRDTRTALEFRLATLGITERAIVRSAVKRAKAAGKTLEKPLVKSLSVYYRRQKGLITRVNFRFSRHGIFVEHGVGRGRSKGSGKESPRAWIESTMRREMPQLADIVAQNSADMIGEQLRFFVPGVIDMQFEVNR